MGFFKVLIMVAKKHFFDIWFEVYVISSVHLKQNFLCIQELSGIALKYRS